MIRILKNYKKIFKSKLKVKERKKQEKQKTKLNVIQKENIKMIKNLKNPHRVIVLPALVRGFVL